MGSVIIGVGEINIVGVDDIGVEAGVPHAAINTKLISRATNKRFNITPPHHNSKSTVITFVMQILVSWS